MWTSKCRYDKISYKTQIFTVCLRICATIVQMHIYIHARVSSKFGMLEYVEKILTRMLIWADIHSHKPSASSGKHSPEGVVLFILEYRVPSSCWCVFANVHPHNAHTEMGVHWGTGWFRFGSGWKGLSTLKVWLHMYKPEHILCTFMKEGPSALSSAFLAREAVSRAGSRQKCGQPLSDFALATSHTIYCDGQCACWLCTKISVSQHELTTRHTYVTQVQGQIVLSFAGNV